MLRSVFDVHAQPAVSHNPVRSLNDCHRRSCGYPSHLDCNFHSGVPRSSNRSCPGLARRIRRKSPIPSIGSRGCNVAILAFEVWFAIGLLARGLAPQGIWACGLWCHSVNVRLASVFHKNAPEGNFFLLRGRLLCRLPFKAFLSTCCFPSRDVTFSCW